jgi:riboflavin biosynthesis pyrimidine reductase
MRDVASRFASPIVVEAGATLFMELLKNGCIEELQLSIVPLEGDSHFIDLDEVLSYLEITDDQIVDGTRLLKCSYTGSSAYS